MKYNMKQRIGRLNKTKRDPPLKRDLSLQSGLTYKKERGKRPKVFKKGK